MANLFDKDKIKDGLKNSIISALLGTREVYETQIRSFEYCQLEMEYAYKKAGGFQNALEIESIRLVDEPDNQVDPHAMAIYAFNVKIGYIPREDTDQVRSLKHKESIAVRFYKYEGMYRGELTITYRSK